MRSKNSTFIILPDRDVPGVNYSALIAGKLRRAGVDAVIVSRACPGVYPHTYNGVNCVPCMGAKEHPPAKRPTFFASIIDRLRKLGGL